ncbi:hypothetical protein ACTMUQ_42445 [Streptomyces sp. SD11]|uniref:hypothetical protein n=1 Tax=Streptomyces sp. SD11 TaxID=3452209 RepID=UPI003F89C3E4
MTITDPDQIPATPIYTITVSATGAAAVDGEAVTEPGLDPNAARVAALAEVRIKAAFMGRPVRVNAKEADGSTWPLIVAVDGAVTTLSHPHPTPPPSPAHAPVQAPPAAPTVAASTQAPHATTAMREAAPEWLAPVPDQYGPLWADLVAHEAAGRLPEATAAAAQLETALTDAYGPLAPPTVQVMTTRAWLTLCQVEASEEWAETTELLVQAAQRRQEAVAPEQDTERLIRNAHAVWLRLAREDAEYARETAEPVLALLVAAPDNTDRSRAMIRVLEEGAAA